MLNIKTLFLALSFTLLVPTAVFAAGAQLSLDECLELASRNSTANRLAGYDGAIQSENVNQAMSSYLPRVDLQAGYTMLNNPQAIKTAGGSFKTQQASFTYASVGVYQTLYDFGRRDKRKDQAAMQARAAVEAAGTVEQDVALQVIRSYFGILQALRLVETAKDEVAQREQHSKIATSFFTEGVTTRNDLLQADVKLAGSRQMLLAEKSRLTNNWLMLNYLTGNPPEYRATLAEEGGVEAPSGNDDRVLLTMRHEIVAQKAAVRAAEARVEESREEFFPELFVKAGIDYLQNDKVVEQTMAEATVGIKVNLFDGLATTSRRRQAVLQLEKEKERLRGMEQAFLLEINTARSDLSVSAERIEVAKTAIKQSEENLRINNDRYQAQVGTATEVVDAQTMLSQTKSDYFQALFDYQVAMARVRRGTGEL